MQFDKLDKNCREKVRFLTQLFKLFIFGLLKNKLKNYSKLDSLSRIIRCLTSFVKYFVTSVE